MLKHGVIRSLMKVGSAEIHYDLKEGASFRELFNHPDFLAKPESVQTELALKWAEHLYYLETNFSSLDSSLGGAMLESTIPSGGKILDIGCYIGGKTIRWLERFKGSEIHGIDIDDNIIKVANAFAKQRSANAFFKINFAEQLDFADSYFDLIITENTFEHVTDLQKVLEECARVLKKGGHMIVIFPSFWGPWSHHLDLVTRTPCLHWIFKYPSLKKAYDSILDERGPSADWYRQNRGDPQPYEKGLTINGTGAKDFRMMIKANWKVVIDGFREPSRNQNHVKRIILNSVKFSRIPIVREMLPIAYFLQKK